MTTPTQSVTLGTLISQTTRILDAVIDEAGSKNNVPLLMIGRQVSYGLDSFRNSCLGMLEQSESTKNKVVFEWLKTIDTAVTSMKNKTDMSLPELIQLNIKVAEVVKHFFSPGLPQITNRMYSYLKDGQVEIKFEGSFPSVAVVGIDPILVIEGGEEYPHLSKSSNSIKFNVPLKRLFPNHPMMRHVTLQIPFFTAIGDSKAQFQFRGHLLSYPFQAGKVTVQWTDETSKSVTRIVEGREFIQSSDEQWGGVKNEVPNTEGHEIYWRESQEQNIDLVYEEPATPGWTITGGKVHLFQQLPYHSTIWTPEFTSSSISARITTEYSDKGGASGGVWFRIDRTEEQTQPEFQPKTAEYTLSWGGSIFQPRLSSWTVTYDKLDGTSPKSFSSSVQSYPIMIEQGELGVRITASALENASF